MGQYASSVTHGAGRSGTASAAQGTAKGVAHMGTTSVVPGRLRRRVAGAICLGEEAKDTWVAKGWVAWAAQGAAWSMSTDWVRGNLQVERSRLLAMFVGMAEPGM
jgi:hypothetical protein